MNQEYLYKSDHYTDSSDIAVIVLPEIFGLTDFITSTTDRFADEFKMSAFALDFFYQLTGKPNKFDYDSDMQKGVELMQQMRGEDFLMIFNNAVHDIMNSHSEIQKLIVCGFCFGGRLSYLAGLNENVKRIISFYGAGANGPDYIEGQSCIESLSSKRTNDTSLSVLSLYGGKDDSIPVEDRAKTKKLLNDAGIQYREVVYPKAGHAFFNNNRVERYDELASKKAWEEIGRFVKQAS